MIACRGGRLHNPSTSVPSGDGFVAAPASNRVKVCSMFVCLVSVVIVVFCLLKDRNVFVTPRAGYVPMSFGAVPVVWWFGASQELFVVVLPILSQEGRWGRDVWAVNPELVCEIHHVNASRVGTRVLIVVSPGTGRCPKTPGHLLWINGC